LVRLSAEQKKLISAQNTYYRAARRQMVLQQYCETASRRFRKVNEKY